MCISNGLRTPARLFSMRVMIFRCSPSHTGIHSVATLLVLLVICLLSARSYADIPVVYDQPLPPSLVWQSTISQPLPTDSVTVPQGGTLTRALVRLPPNVRRLGEATPHSLSDTLEALQLPLLARSGEKMEWIPLLASRWAQTDGKLVFELRQEARWSDQIPVTTDDIAFSIGFISDPQTGADWQARQLQSLISAIQVFNTHQFAFVLKDRSPEAIAALAAFRPFAAHVYRNRQNWPHSFDWYPEPTTGPYHLAQITPGDSLLFRHTSNWWGKSLPLFHNRFNVSRVVLRLPVADQEADLFKLGELDVIPVCPLCIQQKAELTQLSRSQRVSLITYRAADSANGANGLLLNSHTPALSDIRVRRALIEALNANSVATEDDYLHRASGLLPGSKPALKAAQPAMHGLPDALSISFSDAADEPLLKKMAQQAEVKGLHISLRKMSSSELSSKLALGQYDLVWLHFAQPLPADALLSLFIAGRGKVFISNPGVSPSLLSGSHDSKRTARNIEQELISKALFMPGFSPTRLTEGAWEWIQIPAGENNAGNPLDAFDPLSGGNFWIDRKLRAAILAQPERAKKS